MVYNYPHASYVSYMGMVNSSKGEGKLLSPLIVGHCYLSLVAITSLKPNLGSCENPIVCDVDCQDINSCFCNV
jgi:hypothetical protein